MPWWQIAKRYIGMSTFGSHALNFERCYIVKWCALHVDTRYVNSGQLSTVCGYSQSTQQVSYFQNKDFSQWRGGISGHFQCKSYRNWKQALYAWDKPNFLMISYEVCWHGPGTLRDQWNWCSLRLLELLLYKRSNTGRSGNQ